MLPLGPACRKCHAVLGPTLGPGPAWATTPRVSPSLGRCWISGAPRPPHRIPPHYPSLGPCQTIHATSSPRITSPPIHDRHRAERDPLLLFCFEEFRVSSPVRT
ncbi:hypothetical protein CKAH01_07742 [Colletotrichum kahawae]|uniref:Uncharacterized protein n=1 Tax=Colletotrichum kahawae TaxID=34407 RepID=A0AAE0D2T7_COLKA|nr:hypothetical protein CKAH01_07742 [Colletotrichum kahawae]